MLHVFPQHRELRFVQVVARLHGAQFGNELLRAGMLDFGFVQQVGFFQRFAHGRVENFFLDPGVHGQLGAGELHQQLHGFIVFVVLHLFKLVEHLGDPVMVFLQQLQRILLGGMAMVRGLRGRFAAAL